MAHDLPSTVTATILLPAVLNSAAAPELLDMLLAHRTGNIQLDGGAVHRLGGQCLQILLAGHAYTASDDRSFTISPISEELLSMFQIFGVPPDMFSQIPGAAP